jgi:signal peptidase I
LHVDDDILFDKQKEKLEELIIEADSLHPEDGGKVDEFISKAPLRLTAILPKRRFPLIREYVDIIAVAVMVAFGIRGLFFQPFKIPTGSMQPTLFGIHYVDAKVYENLPPILVNVLKGARRAEAEIRLPGFLDINSIMSASSSAFFTDTRFQIGGANYRLPGEAPTVINYTKLSNTHDYQPGEKLCDGWLASGDHLFVDRFSIHFTGLKRGDVVVFNTENILHYNQETGTMRPLNGYYYIKRMIGLPGDTLQLKNNIIHVKPRGEEQFRPITDFNPVFNKLYAGKGGYHGHLNVPGKILGSPEATFTVPEDSYFVLGDNSSSSLDSRYWGVVPRANIVGKGYLVFWPFTRRWGMVDRRDPLDVSTDQELSAMRLQ